MSIAGRLCSPWLLPLLLPLAACEVVPDGEARIAYSQLSLAGDVALSSSAPSGGSTIRTDMEDDLGLGDASGSLYGNAELNTLVGNVSASGFMFSESGRGQLSSGFGDIPPGTPVESDFDFNNLKLFYSYDVFDVGPLRIAPGLGVDIFDVDTTVRSVGPVSAFESVDVFAPVPMLFLETEVDLQVVSAEVEAGGMSINLPDADGTYWDVEAQVVGSPTPFVDLYAGYRYISLDADGTTDGQAFTADLALQGWFIGGGVRF